MDNRVRGLGLALAKYGYLPAAALVILFIAGYLFASTRATTYEASARLVFSASKEFDPFNLSPSYDIQRFMVNQSELIKSRPVINAAHSKLKGGPSAEELRERVRAVAQKEGGVVVVSAKAPTAEQAAEIVNAVTSAYSEHVQSSNKGQAKNLPKGSDTPAALNDLNTKASVYGDGLALRENAQPPSKPTAPQPLRDAVFAGLFGALGTLAFLTVRHLLSPRIRGARRIADRLGVPVIADSCGEGGEQRLQRGLAGVYAAAGSSPLVLMVITPGLPEHATLAARQLARALRDIEPAVSIRSLEDLTDIDSAVALRRQAAITLISAEEIAEDYRVVAYGKAVDGVIAMCSPITLALPLDTTRTVTRQAGIPVIGVVVTDFDEETGAALNGPPTTQPINVRTTPSSSRRVHIKNNS
ncbi:Capsular polysaccharide biosynthesis protein [Austwickia chelonae]|uniref:Polysaccharide chain length determinant N-terminal domain-containing protein n=2 Tax=Austwickia TaxID=1184606 RepID=K6V3X5_9MICO|nr:hypothetical protein AUCHE_03_00450 [Austwickia chelonae NBRC 105200]SEW31238.1 Capsular polysaccharide biosynthesis protein [Austwickia chelonae]